MSNRKRGAPSAVPGVPQQPGIVYPAAGDPTNIPPDAFWDGSNAFGGPGFPNTNNGLDSNNYFSSDITMADASQAGNLPLNTNQPTISGQLVRRDRNNQLALQNRALDVDTWQDFGQDGQVPVWNADEEEDLEQMAAKARKEAQAKKKTIPPFVLKLSSFLDEKRNTDLIRWSDDGNSFIVLNEDEFAKTLIPELFKHNNYASFVRQLNMYGFHKKVGLSDNSMKSSESKVKNPSEYFNKYFKRGKPQLLWLIQKPKTAAGAKRKRDEEKSKGTDSDDEGKKFLPEPEKRHVEEEVVGRNKETAMVPAREINNMRGEIRNVQQQQRLIAQALTRIRQQNDQLYQQARAFQTLHDRHENSINAILTFLATFYNRSVENSNGPNLAEIFSQTLPQNTANHGTVVDVGDYDEDPKDTQGTPRRRKVPLAILPAPEEGDPDTATTSRPTPVRSPSVKAAIRQSIFKPQPAKSPSAKPKSPLIKRDVPTPNFAASTPENDEIMSVIHNSNASQSNSPSQSPQLDFSAALNQLQNSDGGALSPQYRNQLLSYIAANSPNATSPGGTTNDNALTNPEPPPVPSLDTFQNTQTQLDLLQRLQEQQDEKVAGLAEKLQPSLAPTANMTGYVPPSGDLNSLYGTYPQGNDQNELDLNSFINSDVDYFPSTTNDFGAGSTGAPLSDLNFDFDPNDFNANNNGFNNEGTSDLFGTNDGNFQGLDTGDEALGSGRVQSVSSGAASPIPTASGSNKGNGNNASSSSPKKKRRR